MPAGCPRPGRRGDEAGTCIPHWDPRETGRGCRQGWGGGQLPGCKRHGVASPAMGIPSSKGSRTTSAAPGQARSSRDLAVGRYGQ